MNCSVSASRRDPDGNCLENATCWLQGHYPFLCVERKVADLIFTADANVTDVPHVIFLLVVVGERVFVGIPFSLAVSSSRATIWRWLRRSS